MIEIMISRELAQEHPAFVEECGQRGHRVEVFEPRGDRHHADSAPRRDALDEASRREGGIR